MTKQGRIAAIVGGIALVVLLIFLLGQASPKKESKTTRTIVEEPEFTGVARRNKLLAAEYLAGAKGSVTRLKNLAHFDPSVDDVLIINNPTNTLPEQAVDQMLRWVRTGGTIVIEAGGNLSRDDYFLKRLHVRLEPMDEQTATVAMPLYERNITITSSRYLVSERYHSRNFLSDQIKPQLGLVRFGNGEVILLTSFEPFYTRNLDEQDHAALLTDLTWYTNEAWFMYTIFVPPIADDFWRLGWPIIAGLLFALALWAWASSLRIGRLLPVEQPGRRSLHEHIAAAGRYLWKLDEGRDQLLEAVRAATLRELEQHFPGWKSVTEDKQLTLVVKLVNESLTPEQVREALFAELHKNKIAEAISRLAAIRSAV